MATQSLDNCQIYFNDVDMTGYTNQATLTQSSKELDVSTFASDGWTELIGGPRKGTFTLGGPWGFADPDDELWTNLTTTQTTPGLAVSSGGAAGDTAYMMSPVGLDRETGGAYGEAASWTFTGGVAQSGYGGLENGMHRGVLSLVKQTVTGPVNGSALNQTTLGVLDTITMLVNVITDNGTSLDVILESDDNAGFTSPTTRATASVTGVGAYWAATAGLIVGADRYFRARTANLVGTNFELSACIGVGFKST